MDFCTFCIVLSISYLFILAALGAIYEANDNEKARLIIFRSVASCSFVVTFLLHIYTACDKDEPRAIDVYRGRTELEVTSKYKNEELVDKDTIVVFKNIKEEK